MLQITKGSGNISAGKNAGFLVFPILTKKDSARGAYPFGPQAPFNLRSRRHSMKTFALLSGLALLVILAMPTHVAAQATVGTGSIQGTVLDPNGASVPAAKVTITNKGTGQKITPTVTNAGEFNSGPIVSGDYLLRVEAAGFKVVEKTIIVQVGQISSGNVTLEIGSEKTVITVEASAVTVNTEQATVSGVVTQQQIEGLPLNG